MTYSFLATTATVAAAPSNLVDYRGNNGQTYTFSVTTSTGGKIWGTNIYTDDSALATAIVHAGFASNGQKVTATVQILPGQNSYTGSTQNGVTSSSYGSWSGSYRILSTTVIG